MFILAVLIESFWGCGSSSVEKRTEAAPSTIASTLQVATLNLSSLNRRLERKDVTQLAKILRREQVDIVAVHGITRYPNVSTRIDFVKELSAQTDMRNVFGEMVNNSGRQTGNAVFSTYPILSNHNQPFDGVKSASFEAALQTTIDGGASSVTVVSALLPSKVTAEDEAKCLRMIAALNPDENPMPMVVAGNLPASESARVQYGFSDAATLLAGRKPDGVSVWYSGNGLFRPMSTRAIQTDLGPLLVAQFGLYRRPAAEK